ncbi:hypothetical protein QVD17_08990 [Tagetes erecta]|uniref:Uncharacterized protein n=1 Tax=Tagetes erecta TaxID=13708 RepID=A0AAD8L0R0_TARER|nr:hypothetical protein QVD17_08990 [Tagetes erecta]
MNMDVDYDEVHSVEVENINDSGDNKSGSKRQRKERSVVWQYFTKFPKKAIGRKNSRDDEIGALNSNTSKGVKDTSDDSTYAYGVSARLKDFDVFQNIYSNQVSVDELTEDIISLDFSGESNASNTMNNPKAPT